jgi:hypothetical protein
MKLSNDTSNYTTTINKSADFGIEDEDLSHIMGILRSQIYSDKLLAVIREYSTNARDANIEAGNGSPITVTLPTFADPELSFQDYGNGLSDEAVCNLYVKYGASTKRNSNDYTGCLGIGCKAAFAYGDSFQVESTTENKITTWLARIDESKKGTISLLHEKPNEYRGASTGVKVTVHIRKQDIDDCQNKALKFFRHWKAEEITCNVDIIHTPYHTETDDWALLHHDKDTNDYYRHHHPNGNATILMGGIAYPIDTDQCKSLDEGSYILAHNQILLKAPLGSMEIAANRESLEYTDKTKTSINVMANNMRLDLIKLVTQSVANEPTRLQASIKSQMLSEILGFSLSNQLAKDATWQGKPLLTEIRFNKETTKHYKKKNWRDDTYRNHKDKGMERITLTPNAKLVLWDNDTIAEANATRRIRTLQSKDNNLSAEYFIIKKENLDLIEPKLEEADYTNLDDILPLKATRTIINKADGTTTKTVKISVCQLKPARLKTDRLSTESDPVANKNDKFIYVPLDRFDWQGKPQALDNINMMQKALQFFGEEGTVIHGVKKHYLKKLGDNWIKLDDHFRTLWNDWIKTHQYEYSLLMDSISQCRHGIQWPAPDILSSTSVNADIQYIAKVFQMKASTNLGTNGTNDSPLRNTVSILRWLGIVEAPDQFESKVKALNEKYPLLQAIHEHWNQQMPADLIAKELDKYISYIDQQ